MKRILQTVVLLCATLVSVCAGQTTSVSIQVTDTDGQSWNNGFWTAQLVMPPGIPQPLQFVISGTNTVVPNQNQSSGLNGTGNGSLIVTPNTSIAPGGSVWVFNFCPQAKPAACFQQSYTITGTSQNVTPTPPGVRVSVSTPVTLSTAYLDLEITGANLGSTYFNLTDTTIHLCSSVTGIVCTWTVGSGTNVVIGGDLFAISGTQQEVVGLENHPLPALSTGFLQWNGSNWVFSTPGGVISGLTTGKLPKASSSTTITDSQYDDGLTTVNTGTYSGSGGMASPNGPITTGTPPTACGSAPDCIAFGQTATAGTPTAGQNYFKSTSTGWVCSINGSGETSCLSGSVTGATPLGGLVLTGSTLGLRVDCADQQVIQWTLGTTTWGCGTIPTQSNGGISASPLTVATAQISGGGGISVIGYGSIVGNPSLASSVTQTIIAPNLSNGVGDTITSPSSTASTSTITGLNHGAATNIGTVGVGSFYRWATKFAVTATSNVRYWMGYANYNTGGGSGCENVSVLNTTCLASDTPSRGLIGFRYSSTTDTNWKAVACLPAGTCTTVDTGVAIDTSVHVFEMVTQPSGTSVVYLIDGAHSVTVSSNVPPPNLGIGSAGSTGSIFWVGDNKNTANAVSGNFYWMTLTPK